MKRRWRPRIAEHRPGALLMETISNPLLRVAPLDRIAAMAQEAGAQLIVDSTFSTPLIIASAGIGRDISWFTASPNISPAMAT